MREVLIRFLEKIKDYERESENKICYDEREAEELVGIFLDEESKNQNEFHVTGSVSEDCPDDVANALNKMVEVAKETLKQLEDGK